MDRLWTTGAMVLVWPLVMLGGSLGVARANSSILLSRRPFRAVTVDDGGLGDRESGAAPKMTCPQGNRSEKGTEEHAGGSKTPAVALNVSATAQGPTHGPPLGLPIGIRSPVSGSTVNGVVVIAVQGDPGIRWYDVYVDGDFLSSSSVSSFYEEGPYYLDFISPSEFLWNTAGVDPGPHVISVKGYRYDDSLVAEASTSVIVSPQPFAVVSPVSGSSVSGRSPVVLSGDLTRIAWATVFIDDLYVMTYTYPFAWDTTYVTNGAHKLSIELFDSAHRFIGEVSLAVTVDNPGGSPAPGGPTVDTENGFVRYYTQGTVHAMPYTIPSRY